MAMSRGPESQLFRPADSSEISTFLSGETRPQADSSRLERIQELFNEWDRNFALRGDVNCLEIRVTLNGFDYVAKIEEQRGQTVWEDRWELSLKDQAGVHWIGEADGAVLLTTAATQFSADQIIAAMHSSIPIISEQVIDRKPAQQAASFAEFHRSLTQPRLEQTTFAERFPKVAELLQPILNNFRICGTISESLPQNTRRDVEVALERILLRPEVMFMYSKFLSELGLSAAEEEDFDPERELAMEILRPHPRTISGGAQPLNSLSDTQILTILSSPGRIAYLHAAVQSSPSEEWQAVAFQAAEEARVERGFDPEPEEQARLESAGMMDFLERLFKDRTPDTDADGENEES